MMTNEQYLLLKLSEESKEIAFACDKAMQFGLNSDNNGALPLNNKQQIILELNDLLAVVELMNDEMNLGFVPDQQAIVAKKEKLKKYRGISQHLGLVATD